MTDETYTSEGTWKIEGDWIRIESVIVTSDGITLILYRRYTPFEYSRHSATVKEFNELVSKGVKKEES